MPGSPTRRRGRQGTRPDLGVGVDEHEDIASRVTGGEVAAARETQVASGRQDPDPRLVAHGGKGPGGAASLSTTTMSVAPVGHQRRDAPRRVGSAPWARTIAEARTRSP